MPGKTIKSGGTDRIEEGLKMIRLNLNKAGYWLLAFWLAATLVRAEEVPPARATWPQWRGPSRDGVVLGAPWPASLNEKSLKQIWRADLSEGYPGPIVAADRVFVAETKDKKAEIVRALDRETGKELWRTQWDGAMSVPFFASRNGSWIRSTPAFDGENLYVAGMRDALVCLSAADGSQRWRVDFTQRYKTDLPDFGFVSSPLVMDDNLYVQAGASFVKLDKKTGESIWRTLVDGGGMYGSAFSSPVFTKLAGRDQLLVQTRANICGVDAETGAVLWTQEIEAFRGMNIWTPVAYKDGVFTSAYGGKSQFFRISQDPQGKFNVTEVWKSKAQGYMSQPAIVDHYAYLHLRNQRVTCIDLDTGEEKWRTSEKFGEYWSWAAQGDRILALDQEGKLILVKANPEKFERIDARTVSDAETWGHVAVCGDEIFVRELKGISAWRWGGTERVAVAPDTAKVIARP